MTPPVHSFTDAGATALARTLPPARPSAIAAEDWDILFRAIRARLKLSADAPAERVQVIVGECVQALDQLHATLAAERRQSGVPSLQSLVIERFIKPLMPGERDAAARKFTAACSPAKPRSLP